MGPAPGAGPLTFNFAGQQQQACAWSVFEYDNVDGTGTNGSGAVAQQQTTSGSGTTLAADVRAARGCRGEPGGGRHGARHRRSGDRSARGSRRSICSRSGQGTIRGTLQTEDRKGGGSTVNWSWPTTANAGAIALEIKAASVIVPSGPATDAETLARRFEPVLFFSANEQFFPADAKRYVERCALWRAQAPFDAKDSWGGKGGPFPRAPIIDYGKISALAGEPGTPLDSATLVDNQGEERFFDFKGWMDAARMPEPKVTATSKNTFSKRDTIDTVYNKADADGGDQKLRDSRFWYHAELIAADRLRRLLATVRAPDLVKVYDTLQNAVLLNYYFFYPAHDESLAGCTNTEGVEFGGCAGQWGCLSLLLERADTTRDYRPSYIGTSARLLAAPSMVVAQAADDDDTAKRTVMTVDAFGKATLNDGHPRIFVAKGTHALYLAPGSYAVAYPNESHPNFCGGFEGIPPPTAPPETHLADNPLAAQGLFWAKVAAGSSLLGALGAAAGAIWGIVEYAEANHGLNVVGTGSPADNPAPDVAGSPGSGKTVQPPASPCPMPEAMCRTGPLRETSRSTVGATTSSSTAARSPGGPATSIRAAIWAAGDRASRPIPSAGAPACASQLSGASSSWRLPTGKRPARSERRLGGPGAVHCSSPSAAWREGRATGAIRPQTQGGRRRPAVVPRRLTPGAGGRGRATYTHIARFPQLPERGPPVYVTVWRRSRVKSRLPATG